MFGATLVLTLGITGQGVSSWPSPKRDMLSRKPAISTKHTIAYPRDDGPGLGIALPDCINPADVPWTWFTVRCRPFPHGLMVYEFRKPKTKR
jgi:hypothetical protein